MNKGSVKELIEWVTKDELIEAAQYLLAELNKPNSPSKNVPAAKRVLRQAIANAERTSKP